MFHCIVTFLFCCCLGWLDPALCFVPAGFYFGREIAQAEERYIKVHGGKRSECPWYCGFLGDAWNEKSMFDWCGPVVISILFFIIYKFDLIERILYLKLN